MDFRRVLTFANAFPPVLALEVQAGFPVLTSTSCAVKLAHGLDMSYPPLVVVVVCTQPSDDIHNVQSVRDDEGV